TFNKIKYLLKDLPSLKYLQMCFFTIISKKTRSLPNKL
ncbi:hypothetical protein U360_01428, partial [Staphylococcus aureus F81035]